MERRSMLKNGAAAFGALAITAVTNGGSLTKAAQANPGLFPDPAMTQVPNPSWPPIVR